jgi:hypothetical protein
VGQLHVIDRLRVGLYDPTVIDQKLATTWAWTSYSIEGTTNGKWAVGGVCGAGQR